MLWVCLFIFEIKFRKNIYRVYFFFILVLNENICVVLYFRKKFGYLFFQLIFVINGKIQELFGVYYVLFEFLVNYCFDI